MLFEKRAIAPEMLARRMAELMPEYLPGMDTGAAEVTSRRMCWNKTLTAILSVLGKDQNFQINVDGTTQGLKEEQLDLYWKQGDGIALAASTGWGDRGSLEGRLQRLERLKSGQKLFIYTCSLWKEAVLEQINAALLRYPFHLEGEQYLFLNLLGAESRMHLHIAEIKQTGPLGGYRPELLQLVTGSPFVWKAR